MKLEMLQVARLAQRSLSEGAPLVREFIAGLLTPEGGFADRAGAPDLYYTVFGLACQVALEEPVPSDQVGRWLKQFGDGEGLDLVHLCALARCWSLVGGCDRPTADGLLQRIETYRKPKGGYHAVIQAESGNPYGNFMALGAYQDMGLLPPRTSELIEGCLACASNDGGFANEPGLPVGNVPAVAAVETIFRQLETPMPTASMDWLLGQAYPQGGFFAVPEAPMPDLLSTATALHALAGQKVDLGAFKEPCLDFLDTLWVNTGAFYGSWGDTYVDCEYTFYGLLALGHLSL